MLKHMASNGGIGNRVPRLENSLIMEQNTSRYRNNNTNGTVGAVSPTSCRMQMHQSFPLALNASTLNSSKHSLSLLSPAANVPSVGATCKTLNGGLGLSMSVSRARNLVPPLPPPLPPSTNGGCCNNLKHTHNLSNMKHIGVKEMLISLGLLCLVSLLLALLSLIFLLKISPVTANDIRELLRAEQLTVITAEEYAVVYEVTLALTALTLSLNLCCLLVCAIQFLFAVKLVKSPHGGNDRTNKYLQKSSVSRVCAVGGFFISIPVFLTGIILYTFIQFHSTPAIVTSVFIGLGIIFCGCAMVHNVFIWQREKTNAVKELALQQQHEQSQTLAQAQPQPVSSGNGNISYNHSFMLPLHNSTATPYILRPATTTPPTGTGTGTATAPINDNTKHQHPREASGTGTGTGSVSPGMPAMPDLSSVATTNSPHELSTLV